MLIRPRLRSRASKVSASSSSSRTKTVPERVMLHPSVERESFHVYRSHLHQFSFCFICFIQLPCVLTKLVSFLFLFLYWIVSYRPCSHIAYLESSCSLCDSCYRYLLIGPCSVSDRLFVQYHLCSDLLSQGVYFPLYMRCILYASSL